MITNGSGARSPHAPVIVAARRTPIAGAGRGLAEVEAHELGAAVLRAVVGDLRGLGIGTAIDDVVLGNCCGPGGDVARSAVLAAGLGVGTPAVTVDRQCGAGLEAVRLGAALVRSGEADVVLAGGMESASTSTRPEQARFAPEGFADPPMGVAADDLARARGISRERQDGYAARSHERAVAAQRAGVFDAELVPVGGVGTDDRPRPGLDAGKLARFRPAFGDGGTATVGNSCGINDGAAALAIVPEAVRAAAGVPGLAIRATAVAGVDPALPGLGPAPAVRAVLDRGGVALGDVGAFEITEAFAAQVLAATDELGVDPARVCPQGGAIALGHPWGASGALLLVRMFAQMVRESGAPVAAPRFGVATTAIGGGQGLAVLVERVG